MVSASVLRPSNSSSRVLSAVDGAGHAATFGYDALGRVTSQADQISARTMQYDAAGRRTRLTWGDGRYVTYGYKSIARRYGVPMFLGTPSGQIKEFDPSTEVESIIRSK